MSGLTGALTISRDSNEKIRVSIIDRASGARFVELHLALADFAMALTGQAHIDGELAVMDLQNVGKVRVTEKRSARCPIHGDKALLQQWLLENAQEDGWIIDTYLGSQGSVIRQGDETILNYAVKKYIAIEDHQ